MSLFRRISKSTEPEKRDISIDAFLDVNNELISATNSGVPIGYNSAQALSAVGACTRLIKGAIGSLPMDAYKNAGNARQAIRPKPTWIDRPNPEMTQIDFIERVVTSLLLDGNAYLYVVRDRLGNVLELWPIHPLSVAVWRDPETFVIYYTISVNQVRSLVLTEPDILHIKADAPAGFIKGLSPIETHRQTFGLGAAQEEYVARFYKNGASLGGIIEAPAAMAPEATEALAEFFNARHQGLINAHRVGVLTNGATWKPLSITPEQAQLLDSRRFSVEEICRIFAVPPSMVGLLEKTARATAEEDGIRFLKYTLKRWLTHLEQSFSTLLDPDPYYIRFNVDEILRGEMLARYQAYSMGRQWGFLSVNDIHSREDMEPVPAELGGDSYMQPLNMGPLGGVGDPEAPAPPADANHQPNAQPGSPPMGNPASTKGDQAAQDENGD